MGCGHLGKETSDIYNKDCQTVYMFRRSNKYCKRKDLTILVLCLCALALLRLFLSDEGGHVFAGADGLDPEADLLPPLVTINTRAFR